MYDNCGKFVSNKTVLSYDDTEYIKEWFRKFYDKKGSRIGYIRFLGTDFSNQRGVFITSSPSANDLKQVKGTWITRKNLTPSCVYLAVRHCMDATWLNDRDQFLYPQKTMYEDADFVGDCIICSIFHSQNRISSVHGPNHWIPFTAQQMNTRERLDSTFMSDFLAGRLQPISKEVEQRDMFDESEERYIPDGTQPIVLTDAAQAVMDAGLQLYRYYHSQSDSNPNASLYDIKGYFQGFDGKGRMNNSSPDETYTSLLANLRTAHKKLAEQIIPKVYQYRFLK